MTRLTQNNKGFHLEMCTPFRLHTTSKQKYVSMLLKSISFSFHIGEKTKTAWAEMPHYDNDKNRKAKT